MRSINTWFNIAIEDNMRSINTWFNIAIEDNFVVSTLDFALMYLHTNLKLISSK